MSQKLITVHYLYPRPMLSTFTFWLVSNPPAYRSRIRQFSRSSNLPSYLLVPTITSNVTCPSHTALRQPSRWPPLGPWPFCELCVSPKRFLLFVTNYRSVYFYYGPKIVLHPPTLPWIKRFAYRFDRSSSEDLKTFGSILAFSLVEQAHRTVLGL